MFFQRFSNAEARITLRTFKRFSFLMNHLNVYFQVPLFYGCFWKAFATHKTLTLSFKSGLISEGILIPFKPSITLFNLHFKLGHLKYPSIYVKLFCTSNRVICWVKCHVFENLDLEWKSWFNSKFTLYSTNTHEPAKQF